LDIQLASQIEDAVNFALATQLSEEVTVTSLKRESTLQEVPFSVAAPTEDVLQRRGVTDIEVTAGAPPHIGFSHGARSSGLETAMS
jgi:outer membrane receptor protein involved in Fe transport